MQKLILLGVLFSIAGSFAAPFAREANNAVLQQESLRELGSDFLGSLYNYLSYKLQPEGAALIQQDTSKELGSEVLDSLHRYLQNKLAPYLQQVARQQAASLGRRSEEEEVAAMESNDVSTEQLRRALNNYLNGRIGAPSTEKDEVAREQFLSFALPILGSVASNLITDAFRRG